ncbi:MAG: NFACT family protein [Lachnospiraceae bacterium]|nr:NFACT family protein [Lachnospiraceae bacterium]
MAFDGVVMSALTRELKDRLVGGRVMKIAQPEKDELILTIKNYDQYKLLLSADAGLPLVYLTDASKESPLVSPAFCMLLRKHLQSAKLTDISQPGLERIINFDFEHLDDMGDLKKKRLIIEIMGKHSNIILCDDNNTIIDSIKRIPSSVSSVREVLPGREYFVTETVKKTDPVTMDLASFKDTVRAINAGLHESLYKGFTGISPLLANEAVYRAGLDPDLRAADIDDDLLTHLYKTFSRMLEEVAEGSVYPNIVYRDGAPYEFSVVRLSLLESTDAAETVTFDSVSALIREYYVARSNTARIRQRSSDMAKIISNAIGRAAKKYELQQKQLEDTAKRDKYRVYGELLTAFGYMAEPGAKSIKVNNYYTGEDIVIPLDSELSAIDNAKKYFDRYSKQKRTAEATEKFLAETGEELQHLESVKMSLDIAEHEEDLEEIRDELVSCGYMKRPAGRGGKPGAKGAKKSGRRVSEPIRYRTEDGFLISVGRNNYQNDELTFKFANGADWWFHAKGCPGSHVVLKTDGREVPDRVFEQAAAVAAFYSRNRDGEKVEVDYLERKNVKKPNGAKPGFVVYYTNYSMVVRPGTEGLIQEEQ